MPTAPRPFDPGVPLDRRGVPERHPPQRGGVGPGDQPVAVLAPAVGVPEPAQVRLVHRDHEAVPGLPALPFDLPPLVQRGRRPGPVAAAVEALGHRGEGAELIDHQQPGRERGRPRGPGADRDVDPERREEEFLQRPQHRLDAGVHPDAGHPGQHVPAGLAADVGPPLGVDGQGTPQAAEPFPCWLQNLCSSSGQDDRVLRPRPSGAWRNANGRVG